MNLIGPAIQRSADCELVLRSLPEWFGIEQALLGYVRDSEVLPTFGLEESGRLVGFASLREHFPETWELHCIAIDARHRNAGLGSKLLSHAETWLSSNGVRFLQVKTIADCSEGPNYAQTRQFYLKRGYTPLEVFPELWSPENPALLLIKDISAE